MVSKKSSKICTNRSIYTNCGPPPGHVPVSPTPGRGLCCPHSSPTIPYCTAAHWSSEESSASASKACYLKALGVPVVLVGASRAGDAALRAGVLGSRCQ